MDWCAASHACGGVQHDHQRHAAGTPSYLKQHAVGRMSERNHIASPRHRLSASTHGQDGGATTSHPFCFQSGGGPASLTPPCGVASHPPPRSWGARGVGRFAFGPSARSYWRALCQPSSVQPACLPAASVRQDEREMTEGARSRGAALTPGQPGLQLPNEISNHGIQRMPTLPCPVLPVQELLAGDGVTKTLPPPSPSPSSVARALLLHLHLRFGRSLCLHPRRHLPSAHVRACVCVRASSPPPARSPIAHRPLPTHHHPRLAARTRGSQCTRRPPAAPSSLLSPHPQSLSAPARVSGPVR